ncbi:MAG: RsmG family class I SAM-dependent methyltransferase [Acidimicrobiia bacterium]
MKHPEIWLRCAEWVGVEMEAAALERLEVYQKWLAEEAIQAGGLSPGELNRLHDRHIGDSILFAAGFDSIPDQVLDIGSGVGLPGIPLAILLGATRFTLLDRSRRRVDLMRRAIRILGLENVTVEQGEIEHRLDQVPAVVSRATLPPDRARDLIASRLRPGGVAVLGGSWANRPDHVGWVTMEIPATVLDHTIWLLIMRRT